jgi:predicted pyridoxine 5'-phosphate oxidase superfamily flavin-nucleotide-binding protein
MTVQASAQLLAEMGSWERFAQADLEPRSYLLISTSQVLRVTAVSHHAQLNVLH